MRCAMYAFQIQVFTVSKWVIVFFHAASDALCAQRQNSFARLEPPACLNVSFSLRVIMPDSQNTCSAGTSWMQRD